MLTAVGECRAILRGHGYSALSKMAALFSDADVNVTWEGDNHMLLQQQSKYLMHVRGKKQSTQIMDISFVHGEVQVDQAKVIEGARRLALLADMLQELFRVKYRNAAAKMEELRGRCKDKEEVWEQFHPEAGNSLALSYGTMGISQPTYFSLKVSGEGWSQWTLSQSESS